MTGVGLHDDESFLPKFVSCEYWCLVGRLYATGGRRNRLRTACCGADNIHVLLFACVKYYAVVIVNISILFVIFSVGM